MWLHITFTDGSNPYFMYGTEQKLRKEINRWDKNYDLTIRNSEQLGVLGHAKLLGFDVTATKKKERQKSYDEC